MRNFPEMLTLIHSYPISLVTHDGTPLKYQINNASANALLQYQTSPNTLFPALKKARNNTE